MGQQRAEGPYIFSQSPTNSVLSRNSGLTEAIAALPFIPATPSMVTNDTLSSRYKIITKSKPPIMAIGSVLKL